MCLDMSFFSKHCLVYKQSHNFCVWEDVRFLFREPIFRHLEPCSFLLVYFIYQLKGALRGLKTPFILQGTYVEPVLVSFPEQIYRQFETSSFWFSSIEVYPQKSAFRGLKAPFMLQATYVEPWKKKHFRLPHSLSWVCYMRIDHFCWHSLWKTFDLLL